MRIELKETFEKDMQNGVNLFLGAGFSIYAKDINGINFPVGSELCVELTDHFNCPSINDLSKICTIIDSSASEALKSFLINRFTVHEYEPFYDILLNLNTPRIFTTNIDNLVSSVFNKSKDKYLNNVFKNGNSFNDLNAVDYIPIHGTIEEPEEKFLFNAQELASSFNSRRAAWNSLSLSVEQLPSVFIGYSLGDVGAIEALFNNSYNIETQKNKWIVLRSENSATEAYFTALGFKIIVAETKEFIEYLDTIPKASKIKSDSEDHIYEIFPQSKVPRDSSNIKIRPIDEFFLGDSPIWSDVLSNRIYATSHLDKIINIVDSKKNLIVTGIPASGKSTILLQLAKKISQSKRTLIFNDLTINKARIISNEIKSSSVVLIDNFTNDIDAFLSLAYNSNIQLIGFDRYYYIDILSHRMDTNLYDFYDISDLLPSDIQGIYQKIPLNLRKSPMISRKSDNEIPSVFEIVNYNINKPSINDRYTPILKDLEKNNSSLLELLIISSYLHSCRTPVSFEIISAFLEEQLLDYEEITSLINSLKGMVDEVIGEVLDEFEDQDYYQPRSQILAETIISQTKSPVFRSTFEKFHNNVPKHIIPKYYVFKRNAYDAYFITKAYSNWKDGLRFYELVFKSDKTPFILQQCALYLLKKKRYSEAALKIDEALQISKVRIFSVENTHAIILFKANINTTSNDSQTRDILDRSMQILMKCYRDDQRKTYHAITFAEQSLEYFYRFGDRSATEYLDMANTWLSEIQIEKKYNHRVRNLISQIQKIK